MSLLSVARIGSTQPARPGLVSSATRNASTAVPATRHQEPARKLGAPVTKRYLPTSKPSDALAKMRAKADFKLRYGAR